VPRGLGADAGWQWRDPTGRGRYEFLPEGALRIAIAPKPFQVVDEPANAPALLLELTGDFTLSTSVQGPGGILLRQEPAPVLYLGRYIWLRDEVRFGRHAGEEGRGPFSDTAIARGKLAADVLQLRLERRGSRVSAWCSANGSDWFDCGEAGMESGTPLLAGFFATGGDREETGCRFEACRLWSEGKL
jgi:hypothetical protein